MPYKDRERANARMRRWRKVHADPRYGTDEYRKWNAERMRERRAHPIKGVLDRNHRTKQMRLVAIQRMREELSAA